MSILDLGNNEFINYEFHENLGKNTIVFSNSLGSDLSMWDPQAEYFKDDYQIIRYDKRGHGKSSPAKGPYSFDMLENDVIKIMDDLEIEKANFVGLSMGGMGTFEMVYRNPRMFAAAFAICGGANPKISNRIRRPAWRIDHGDRDNVVPIMHSKLMYESMKKEKIDVIFKIHEGVYHNSWNNVFSDPEFIPWLFAQSK